MAKQFKQPLSTGNQSPFRKREEMKQQMKMKVKKKLRMKNTMRPEKMKVKVMKAMMTSPKTN